MVFHPRQTMNLMEKNLFGFGAFIKTSQFGDIELYIKTLLTVMFKPMQIQKMIEVGTFRCGFLRDDEKTIEDFIKEFNPDIIHTLHTQTSAYQLLPIRKSWKGRFPIWIHSVWGSDLYLWTRISRENEILKELMLYIDFFVGEGKRDEALAKELGFKGSFFGPMPASGIRNKKNKEYTIY